MIPQMTVVADLTRSEDEVKYIVKVLNKLPHMWLTWHIALVFEWTLGRVMRRRKKQRKLPKFTMQKYLKRL